MINTGAFNRVARPVLRPKLIDVRQEKLRKRTLFYGIIAAALATGGIWFASLDRETRGILAAMPTNTDVLLWSQNQRDAAFRALDRMRHLVIASNADWPRATKGPEGDAREAFYKQVQALIDAGE